MATLPTRKVEIEFDAGVWTDVAADTVRVSTVRGRNRESGAFEAGTITVVLRNDTRKYDPDHAAGTYYGKLRPNRRIRLRATYSAVTYDVFVGYIDRITQNYAGPNDATATIEATDFFKLLRLVELPASVYASEVDEDNPVLWWRLDEPAGSLTAFDASGNNRDGTVTGAVTFGQSDLVVRDPGGAVGFTESTAYIESPASLTFTGTNTWAIEWWMKLNANPTLIQEVVAGVKGSPATTRLSIQINNVTKLLGVVVTNNAGTFYQVGYATPLVAGTTYHFVLTHAADRVLRLYVNGALGATGDTTAGTIEMDRIYAGSPTGLAAPNAVVDEFAVYAGTIPTAGRIDDHYDAGTIPWVGDSPGTRLTRIAELVNVSGDYEFDVGTTTLQATDLGGDALTYMQKVEETEAGRLFVTVDGTVRFLGRQEAETGDYLTSQATLVDDDSGAGIPYRNVSADVDFAMLVTRATVSRDGSVAITYYDATAQAEFGWLDEVHTGLLHNSDSYSRAYAEWIVNTHKTPTSRVGAMTLELAKDPAAMYPAILALELAERVTYKRKPQNAGSVISIPMRVEKISHDTGAHYWQTTLQLSPFYLTPGQALWILGVAGLSELEQTTYLGL